MRAMLLRRIGPVAGDSQPLEPADLPIPEPRPGEILLQVTVCGICHTELDEIEGRTPPPRLPVVPGHQAVGRVQRVGECVTAFREGDRAGVAWIYHACGQCAQCAVGDEAYRLTRVDCFGVSPRGKTRPVRVRGHVAWLRSVPESTVCRIASMRPIVQNGNTVAVHVWFE